MCQTTIHPIRLGYVRAFLLKRERAVLVDTGCPGQEKRLVAALRREGVEPERLSLVVITHAHLDHTGCARFLQEECGVRVACHPAEAEHLERGRSVPGKVIGPAAFLTGLLERWAPDEYAPVAPDVLLSDGDRLDEYGVEAIVRHTPGHTPGSISIELADGTMVVGDALRGRVFAHARPAYPFIAVDAEMAKATAHALTRRQRGPIHTSHFGPL